MGQVLMLHTKFLSICALILLPLSCVSITQEDVAKAYLTNPAGPWPPYKRGKGKYKYVLNQYALSRGLVVSSTERLRFALNKLKQGQNIIISTIGGSITAGQGAADGYNYPQYLGKWFDDHYGKGKVQIANGAVGGTMCTYMVVCMNVHVPKHADIVFVEYNENDHAHVGFAHIERRSYERLLRKLLSLPNQPAVIIMNAFSYTMPGHPHGQYWHSTERDYYEFATFYGIPMISLKAAVYHLMVANVTGFGTRPRNQDMDNLKGVAFNHDNIHPDGNTGFRIMFELALSLLNNTLASLDQRPFTAEEEEAATAQLPPPMIPNNYPSVSDRCFIGNHFTTIATLKQGFEWLNDARSGPLKKFGMIATEPGSILELTVDTRSTASAAAVSPEGRDAAFSASADPDWKKYHNLVQVELAFLMSYERMGKANVTCASGCECDPIVLNGHTTHRSSQLHLTPFYVSQSEKCVLRIEVLQSTDSQGHKVKITGLMLSEEAGRHRPQMGHLTVEYVHHISMEAKDNIFDVTNHVRRRRH